MNRRNRLKSGNCWASAPLLAAVVLLAADRAQAGDCKDLENPVFIAGSSAAKPFIAAVAAELRQLTPRITVVYQSLGSCDGVNSIVGPKALTGTGITFTADAKDDPTGCMLTDTAVDIGVSDVYAESCGVSSLPAGIKDFYGPVQAMTFAVPMASSQTVISAEAAYLVYGFGNASEVDPWNDETKLEQRSETSGTQQMIAAFIKVPANKWKGHANKGSGDLLTSLVASATAGNADKAIGILATDLVDKNRDKLKALAFQAYGQSCGYWPDSTANGFDKANVRDGHYAMWGPLHMLTKTTGGNVANEHVKLLLDYLSGEKAPEIFDLIQVEAKGGVVPGCAMRAARTKDGGELMSFMPEKSCECKFIKEATGTAPDSCKSCQSKDECPASAPACNFNFCEVK